MNLLVFGTKGLKIGALVFSDHSYFEFLIAELTLDFKKYSKNIVFAFEYLYNAPGILIETHKIPFSGSISKN